jgi:hypothetical protein
MSCPGPRTATRRSRPARIAAISAAPLTTMNAEAAGVLAAKIPAPRGTSRYEARLATSSISSAEKRSKNGKRGRKPGASKGAVRVRGVFANGSIP